MDRARNNFLACSGFAGDENAGVSRSDFGHEGKYPLQRGRSSDDLIEQRRLIDFFAQSGSRVSVSLRTVLDPR
jgi:hypothetical protein